jgi:excisionase family DNA binding protein
MSVIPTGRPSGEPAGRDVLLTADEVASFLRVTRGWVYAETRARRIPHVRLGRYVRYRRSAVEAWISGLEERSTDAAAAPAPLPHAVRVERHL